MNAQMQLQRLQNEIEEEVKKYNGMEKKAQQFVQARNSLMQQQSENSMVLKQIEILPEDAKIYKQVGGVLIDQTRKQAKTTLSHRIGHINTQIQNTTELLRKNDIEQKAMAEKIQKAKEAYYKMVSMIQGQTA